MDNYKNSNSSAILPEAFIKRIQDTMFMTGGNTDAEKDIYLLGAKTGYRIANEITENLTWDAALRVVELWLSEFCNKELPYYDMVANAAREASREIDRLRRERSQEEVTKLKELIKASHYAGWYNGTVNSYKHEFSWEQFKTDNNL